MSDQTSGDEQAEREPVERADRRTSDNVSSPVPFADPVAEANWKARAAVAVVLAALVLTGYIIGTTLAPRWWAHRVGDRVDGSITAGTLFGLLLGFVFTFFALVVARQALRHLAWKKRALILVGALVVAGPNLLTLSIVLGNGSGAHAGDRILDVEGPGFRSGTAWGAALAGLVAIGLFVWAWKARRDRLALKSMKAERRKAPHDAEQGRSSSD